MSESIRKASMWMPMSSELFDPDFAAHVRGVLDGTITVPPDLPDPGPHPAYLTLLEAARAAGPVLAELVELHQPHARCYPAVIDWHCEGEEPHGYDAEWADWPCVTTQIIAEHLGVEVPQP